MTKSEIFKAAWLNVKQNGVSLSVALKSAWAASKAKGRKNNDIIYDAKEIASYMFKNEAETIPASFQMMFVASVKDKSQSEIDVLKKTILTKFADRTILRTEEGYSEYVSMLNVKLITVCALTGKRDVCFSNK